MIRLMRAKALRLDGLSLIAGALLVLAFAPFNIWPLAIVCPLLLLLCWHNASATRASLRGLLFGIGLFGVGSSWIFISINTYGGTGTSIALLITAAFVTLLAVLFAVQGYIQQKLSCPSAYKLLFIFPVSWLVCELLRSCLFTGFPWLLLGYSQVNSPLSGWIPVSSVYGMSLIILSCSSLIACAMLYRTLRLYSLLAMTLLFALGFGLKQIHWTHSQGRAMSVSLVQGDIPQTLKWDPKHLNTIINTYDSLTQAHWQDIVIWPENAIPTFPSEISEYMNALNAFATERNSALLLGMPLQHEDHYFNAALALGQGQGLYSKRHLVPFGEYIPLNRYLGKVLQFMNIPMSEFSPGNAKQTLLTLQGIPTAVYICYEIAYGFEVRQTLDDAQLIVTIADDSWFGHSLGAPQQAQTAQARAIESGRYVLSGSNDGITEIIAPNGTVLAQAPRYTPTVVTGKVYAMQGQTPWMRLGMWTVLGLGVLLLAGSYLAKKRLG